jgi:hypothetical protein
MVRSFSEISRTKSVRRKLPCIEPGQLRANYYAIVSLCDFLLGQSALGERLTSGEAVAVIPGAIDIWNPVGASLQSIPLVRFLLSIA